MARRSSLRSQWQNLSRLQLSSESSETPEAAIQGPGAASAVLFTPAIRTRMMVPKQGEGTCSLA